MSNENRTLTAAERAALANAREAEAQRRKYAAKSDAKKASVPVNRVNTAARTAHNTNEYPKSAIKRQAPTATKAAPKAMPKAEKVDTGEFPTYVRTGKGGYHPPKTEKRKVVKNRRPLDPRVKAAIAAVAVLALIFIILLLCGVRYTTYHLSNGGEIKFFGTVKQGIPSSGWIASSDGVKGSLKSNKIEYSDGSVYEGTIVNAMRQGQGKMTYKNGDVYEGTFLEDKMYGSFTVNYANGDSYIGPIVNNVREGYGTISYKYEDGYDIYEGQFASDKKNGKGKMTYADGNVYEGEFVNDLKSGNGVLTYAEGDVYEGTFVNDIRGEGTYRFANGATFVGRFEQNESNQMLEGTYTYTNGTSVTGKFDKETQTFIEQ